MECVCWASRAFSLGREGEFSVSALLDLGESSFDTAEKTDIEAKGEWDGRPERRNLRCTHQPCKARTVQ